LTVDEAGFDAAMEAQRSRARAAGKFSIDYGDKLDVSGKTDFTGYTQQAGSAKIAGLFKDGKTVTNVQAGDENISIVLNNTPFYAESGGQVGDTGVLRTDNAEFIVKDTRKQGDVFVHAGQLASGELNAGDQINAEIDQARRQQIVLNHSATHLMHAALRDVLGTHVEQKGSLVNEERLRFDFSHFEPMTSEQMAEVENIVNEQIRQNNAAAAEEMSMDAAMEKGAMALFGEKYGNEVRVVQMGFSTELCGGTHVERTGDIGLFKIISEGGVAAGVRRVEAVTGQNALAAIMETEQRLQQIAGMLKASTSNADEKVESLIQKNRGLEKELEQLKGKLASQAGSDLVSNAVDIAGIQVLAAKLEGVDPKSLRDTVDQLKNKLGKGIVVLGTVANDKVSLVAGVTKAETKQIKAGDLVNHVATQVGGKGGGRPDMAMAGGSDIAALDGALASVNDWVKEQLA